MELRRQYLEMENELTKWRETAVRSQPLHKYAFM